MPTHNAFRNLPTPRKTQQFQYGYYFKYIKDWRDFNLKSISASYKISSTDIQIRNRHCKCDCPPLLSFVNQFIYYLTPAIRFFRHLYIVYPFALNLTRICTISDSLWSNFYSSENVASPCFLIYLSMFYQWLFRKRIYYWIFRTDVEYCAKNASI